MDREFYKLAERDPDNPDSHGSRRLVHPPLPDVQREILPDNATSAQRAAATRRYNADCAQREKDLRLIDCFRTVTPFHLNPVEMARKGKGESKLFQGVTNKVDSWFEHKFTAVSVTGKGGGGTGKTTTAISSAFCLAKAQQSVLLVNLDGQPSMEERVIGKLVETVYNGSWKRFYSMNGMDDGWDNNDYPTDVLEALKSSKAVRNPLGTAALVPPKLIAVDSVRLASNGYEDVTGGSTRVYIMRSSENISEWENELSRCKMMMAGGMPDGFRIPGTLHSLLQMTCYLLSLKHCIIDLGPGNGLLIKNALFSSHGFFLAVGPDWKGISTVNSLATSMLGRPAYEAYEHAIANAGAAAAGAVGAGTLASAVIAAANLANGAADGAAGGLGQHSWPPTEFNQQIEEDEEDSKGWAEQMYRLRKRSVRRDPPYQMPEQPPKFLGVVFCRVGIRGAVRFFNQRLTTLRVNDRATRVLLPLLSTLGMTLPHHAYSALANRAQTVLNTYPVHSPTLVPQVAPGVVALMRDYDQLQHMSEREGVPVAFLQRHAFLTLTNDAHDRAVAAVIAGLPIPAEHELLSKPDGNGNNLWNKVVSICIMAKNLMEAIKARDGGNYDFLNPEPAVPGNDDDDGDGGDDGAGGGGRRKKRAANA